MTSKMASFILYLMFEKNEEVKINAEQPDRYKLITEKATAIKQKWHSYEGKIERKIKVMTKNIHLSYKEEKST